MEVSGLLGTAVMVEFEKCPVCGGRAIVRLPEAWRDTVLAGGRIDVVECGNPWHYAGLDEFQPLLSEDITIDDQSLPRLDRIVDLLDVIARELTRAGDR